jgi:HD-like signal output (HDOD) protein
MNNLINDLNPNKKDKNLLSKILTFIKSINKEPETESQILIDIDKYHTLQHNTIKKQSPPIEKLFLEYLKSKSEDESFNLPTFPSIVVKLNEAVSSPKSNFSVFSDIIKLDPSLTLKILKLANSPLYKRNDDIVNLEDAIGLIGLKATKNLILSVVMKGSLFKSGYSEKLTKKFFKDALLTAIIAENFAKLQSLNESFLYTLALLHNIGGIVALNSANNFIKENKIELPENELLLRIINKFKDQLTKSILKKWKFKDLYIQAVINQDSIKEEKENILSKILYFAQTVSKSLLSGELKTLDKDGLTLFYEQVLKNAKLNIFSRTARIIMNESIREFELVSRFIS